MNKGQFHEADRLHPLILVGKMWAELVDWANVNLLKPEPALASPADLKIPQCVNTADEAIALIRAHHGRWREKP
jgi:hypothetical protein